MSFDEVRQWLLLFHSILQRLLKNVIEFIPIDRLVLVDAPEVNVDHFIDLLTCLCLHRHHPSVRLTGMVLRFLVPLLLRRGGSSDCSLGRWFFSFFLVLRCVFASVCEASYR